MEFGFTEEQQRFRQEVREFCQKEPWGELHPECFMPYSPSLYNKMAEKGWIGLQFPKRYGGLGKDAIYEQIFQEEVGYSLAPLGPYGLSILLGDLIIRWGTEQQKKEYLPRILKGEITGGKAYTEPEAGSDLASVQTRAVRKGDYYVVNGQKMFTTFIHIQNGYSVLMARTDPDAPLEKGISLFILENKAPGVSCAPMSVISGTRTSQTFLDDVKIPRENLIGEENCGWDYYMKTKDNYWLTDRTVILETQHRIFDELVKYVRETKSGGRPLSQNPAVRRKIAEMAIDIQTVRLFYYRWAWMLSKGLDAFTFAATYKVLADSICFGFPNKAMQILGLFGQLAGGSSHAPFGGMVEALYRLTSIFHFVDGGSLAARNYIATLVLGLPEFLRGGA